LKVTYQKRFLTDLAKVPAEIRKGVEKFVFEEVPKLNSLGESGKIEQMKGYKGYYKARFGSYRVGLKVEADTVSFERVLHRKEIYRYFP
jgi:mRNA interferase RelE/StbE